MAFFVLNVPFPDQAQSSLPLASLCKSLYLQLNSAVGLMVKSALTLWYSNKQKQSGQLGLKNLALNPDFLKGNAVA